MREQPRCDLFPRGIHIYYTKMKTSVEAFIGYNQPRFLHVIKSALELGIIPQEDKPIKLASRVTFQN